MKKYTLYFAPLFLVILLIGCTADQSHEEKTLVIYSEAPVKAIDGIVEEGLEGSQNTTVTLSWTNLSTGDFLQTVVIKETYDNEDNASNAWKIRREGMHIIFKEVSGNSLTYENTNALHKNYEEIKDLIKDNSSWKIIQE